MVVWQLTTWIRMLLTYYSGFLRRYSLYASVVLACMAFIRSKIVWTFQSGVPGPVIMIRSSGPPSSASANFTLAARKSAPASWPFSKLEWRRRTGKDFPAVKNLHFGNWGLETILATPYAPHPSGWVGLVPSFRAPRPNRNLIFSFWRLRCKALNIPGGGGSCRKRSTLVFYFHFFVSSSVQTTAASPWQHWAADRCKVHKTTMFLFRRKWRCHHGNMMEPPKVLGDARSFRLGFGRHFAVVAFGVWGESVWSNVRSFCAWVFLFAEWILCLVNSPPSLES